MSLLSGLYDFSARRLSWILLLASVAIFELVALYFQHVMLLAPCVMCIYERVALFGISAGALVGLAKPDLLVFRSLGLALWIGSAYKGLALSLQHVDYQFNPSPFATCDVFVSFPSWAPLNEWAPWLFEAYGDCSKVVWQFLDYSMPQWLVVIFAGYLIVGVLFMLIQLVGLVKAQEETNHSVL